jgi:HK97 gp10 family phage protein
MAGQGGHSRTGGGSASGGSIQVKIVGLDRLAAQLEELETKINGACFKALKESAEAVVASTKADVRKDSGNLRDSVKARFENRRLRAEVGWWDADDRYAVDQEFGTKAMSANPSIGPALEAERNKVGDRIKTEVRKVLRS